MAKEKTAFLIYEDWETIFNSLDNNEEAGQLIKSLFAFAKRGEVAKFKGALKMAFIVMSQQIARDNNRYSYKCERNKKIALEREEQKRLERLNNSTNVHERARTYTNSTYTDTDTDTDTDAKRKKAKKQKFGEFQHVLLTDEEHKKLVEDYGEKTAALYIKKVDEYCEQSGKKYKNYNLAIRNTFMQRDNIKPINQSVSDLYEGLTQDSDGFYVDEDGNRYV